MARPVAELQGPCHTGHHDGSTAKAIHESRHRFRFRSQHRQTCLTRMRYQAVSRSLPRTAAYPYRVKVRSVAAAIKAPGAAVESQPLGFRVQGSHSLIELAEHDGDPFKSGSTQPVR